MGNPAQPFDPLALIDVGSGVYVRLEGGLLRLLSESGQGFDSTMWLSRESLAALNRYAEAAFAYHEARRARAAVASS